MKVNCVLWAGPGFGQDKASGEQDSARAYLHDDEGDDGDDECEEGSPVI